MSRKSNPLSPSIFDGCIDQQELARQIGRHPRTLDRWALEGYGPPSFRLGRARFYFADDVRQWLQRQRRNGRRPR